MQDKFDDKCLQLMLNCSRHAVIITYHPMIILVLTHYVDITSQAINRNISSVKRQEM